jgi:hypothetical protein
MHDPGGTRPKGGNGGARPGSGATEAGRAAIGSGGPDGRVGPTGAAAGATVDRQDVDPATASWLIRRFGARPPLAATLAAQAGRGEARHD